MAKNAAKPTDKQKKQEDYGVAEIRASELMEAPELPYLPRDPKTYRPAIGLIGCGGISEMHLRAYRAAHYNIVALCDVDPKRAEGRRQEFYSQAEVFTGYQELLDRDDIEVVDITTHPEVRGPIIEAAIHAGKHILSQKPFVIDLDEGDRLVVLARRRKVKLAVNQNGRWAPHFSYIRQAVTAGLIGRPIAAHLSVHWDHNWISDTPFNNVRHIALYDFGIHWFDMVACIMAGRTAERVYATCTLSPSQKAQPPLLAQVLITYGDAQVSLVFDADTRFGAQDRTFVAGTEGSISSVGPDYNQQSLTIYTSRGHGTPQLEGTWFTNGFHGTMAELLCAIEEDRQPSNNAADNLDSLALCFAAVESAERGQPIRPGSVRALPV